MPDIYQYIYLSPHYDDAVLSCGGSIHHYSQAGQMALVITIFAAPPDAADPLSPYAAGMHARWGTPADAVAARQAEDRAAMHILGADYLRLKFLDCIYRGEPDEGHWFYNRDEDIFGSLHPSDVPLVGQIVEAVLELAPLGESTLLVAPLGVGHHVDHQLTRAAAHRLQQMGCRLAFYEDYPYADPYFAGRYPYPLVEALQAQAALNLQPQVQYLTEADMSAKIAAVRAYASQLDVLFDSPDAAAERLREYALSVGQGRPAERIWIPSAPAQG